jgi:hypothetical protein
MNMFSVTGEPEECDVVTQAIKGHLCDIYKQFDVPWRYVCFIMRTCLGPVVVKRLNYFHCG